MFAIHALAAWRVAPGSRSLILCLVRRGDRSLKAVIELLQALLTPVVAIATTYIAYQQYRIRRDEKSLAMYDRRLAVFKNAIGILDRIRAGDALVTEDALSWATSVAEAEFLFGSEVQALLDPLFDAVHDYAMASEPVSLGAKQYDTVCAEAAIHVEFFRRPLLETFSPYLRPAGAPLPRKRRLSVKQVETLIPQKATTPNTDEDIPL